MLPWGPSTQVFSQMSFKQLRGNLHVFCVCVYYQLFFVLVCQGWTGTVHWLTGLGHYWDQNSYFS